MSTLKAKAENILLEKNEKIIPENIKKDITIFNITGTLESTITQEEYDECYELTEYILGNTTPSGLDEIIIGNKYRFTPKMNLTRPEKSVSSTYIIYFEIPEEQPIPGPYESPTVVTEVIISSYKATYYEVQDLEENTPKCSISYDFYDTDGWYDNYNEEPKNPPTFEMTVTNISGGEISGDVLDVLKEYFEIELI